MDDTAALIAELRGRARKAHGGTSYTSDLLIKAADALEVARIVDEERAHFTKRSMRLESHLVVAVHALEIIAGKSQCRDNLMGNQDVAEAALKAIGDAVPKSWTENLK